MVATSYQLCFTAHQLPQNSLCATIFSPQPLSCLLTIHTHNNTHLHSPLPDLFLSCWHLTSWFQPFSHNWWASVAEFPERRFMRSCPFIHVRRLWRDEGNSKCRCAQIPLQTVGFPCSSPFLAPWGYLNNDPSIHPSFLYYFFLNRITGCIRREITSGMKMIYTPILSRIKCTQWWRRM